MLKLHREFIIASLLVCAGLASVLGSADQREQTPLSTRIFRVESPTSEGAPYTVLSTADGRVYTVNPTNERLVQMLLELSMDDSSRVPVQLTLAGDEIIAVRVLSASDATAYKDPVSDMPSEKIAEEVDGTNTAAVIEVPTDPVPPSDDAIYEDEVVPVPAPSPVQGPVVVPAPVRAVVAPQPREIAEFMKKPHYYQPTILNSVAQAQQLFDEERNLNSKAQCHERAMVWSYDMYRKRGIKSMKVMMFYTLKFRKTFKEGNEDYRWWYHTAPLVYVREQNGIQPYVIDREFLDRAVPLDQWSYHFMVTSIINTTNVNIPGTSNKRELSFKQAICKPIDNFRQYALPNLLGEINEETPWCQVRIFPMYYMQPADAASMDCDEATDANYTCGLTGKCTWTGRPQGTKVLEKLRDGRYKKICRNEILTTFREGDLKVAYKKATERAPNPRTRR